MEGAATGPGAGQRYEAGGRREVAGEHWTPAGSVRGPLPQQEAEALAERGMVRIADPIPLGLAGFAAATFTVSTVLAGWFSLSILPVTIPVLLVFGGIAQFLAGMWAYARGNVLAATAFGSFGSFNTAFAILIWMQTAGIVPNVLMPASEQAWVTGIFILMFSLIALYLGVAALSENGMVAAVLLVLALAYLADGTGVWIGGRNWLLAVGGYVGIVSAILAFYTSAAIVVNSMRRRATLTTLQMHSHR